MKTSLKTIACLTVFGLIYGSVSTASACPLRGLARAAARPGGGGGGLVMKLGATAAKIAIQQAVPGGNDIKKQIIGGAIELGVRGGLKAASQLRQNGGFGSSSSYPSTYSVPRNSIPAPIQDVVQEQVEPAAPEVVETPAPAAIDLKLAELRLVDNGNEEQGPSYRLTVQNVGAGDVTAEITIALLASMEADSDDNVSALGSLPGLKVGETKTVELRLPPGSQVLKHLTAAVAPTEAADADETDNIAVLQR